MTKKDIVKKISEKFDIPQIYVKELVQSVLDEMIGSLAEDGRLELRNFGVFEVKHRPAGTARNPKTNKTVKTKSRYRVAFKPGKDMANKVQKVQASQARAAKKAQTAK